MNGGSHLRNVPTITLNVWNNIRVFNNMLYPTSVVIVDANYIFTHYVILNGNRRICDGTTSFILYISI